MPHALDDILDSLTTAVIRLEADGRVGYLNTAAVDLLETGARHARDHDLREILPVDEHLVAYVERARRNGEPLAIAELVLMCGAPPGRRRSVACEILPLENGVVQVEIRMLDRRLAIAEENSVHLDRQSQRLLFQALAHEIKNPLSGLRGAAQLLASEAGDNVPREYLDVMLRETDRLRDLVDGLLGPARAPRFSPVNIHAVLEHVHAILAVDLPTTLAWQRDYDPSLPELQADADHLTQVFLNLAGNAIEAMNGEGGLRVKTRVERHFIRGQRHRMALRVDIEDNGPGVPEEMRTSLFLPLVTSRAEGTGLGLSIAQDIVQRHGGVIEWTSVPGNTVFSVILPLQEDIDTRESNRNE
ncbi:MAG: PAS domain-containing protein [Proteobacteria bacterium]|nr:PAS domain-containing protein [Pseudomonadota bacterium]